MFLLFNPSLKIFAAETVCEAGDDYCQTASKRCACKPDYSGYSCYECASGVCIAEKRQLSL